MGEVTSRVIYAAPRDSVEQGVYLSPEEDTAKCRKLSSRTSYLCPRLPDLEVDEEHAINLDLDANTNFQDRA